MCSIVGQSAAAPTCEQERKFTLPGSELPSISSSFESAPSLKALPQDAACDSARAFLGPVFSHAMPVNHIQVWGELQERRLDGVCNEAARSVALHDIHIQGCDARLPASLACECRCMWMLGYQGLQDCRSSTSTACSAGPEGAVLCVVWQRQKHEARQRVSSVHCL